VQDNSAGVVSTQRTALLRHIAGTCWRSKPACGTDMVHCQAQVKQ
jgi:hypothetical protein